MEDQILKLIQDIGNNGENIGPEQELLESGILDSLAFITLLEEIAVRWRIEIQPTQVPPEEWKPFVLLPGCWKRKWWKRHPKYAASK